MSNEKKISDSAFAAAFASALRIAKDCVDDDRASASICADLEVMRDRFIELGRAEARPDIELARQPVGFLAAEISFANRTFGAGIEFVFDGPMNRLYLLIFVTPDVCSRISRTLLREARYVEVVEKSGFASVLKDLPLRNLDPDRGEIDCYPKILTTRPSFVLRAYGLKR